MQVGAGLSLTRGKEIERESNRKQTNRQQNQKRGKELEKKTEKEGEKEMGKGGGESILWVGSHVYLGTLSAVAHYTMMSLNQTAIETELHSYGSSPQNASFSPEGTLRIGNEAILGAVTENHFIYSTTHPAVLNESDLSLL